MSKEEDKALLAPFRKARESARRAEATGELLMRASFHVPEPSDKTELQRLAHLCFDEGQKIRDSVPSPGERPTDVH